LTILTPSAFAAGFPGITVAADEKAGTFAAATRTAEPAGLYGAVTAAGVVATRPT
jgi:hypothetical protein